MPQLDPQQGLLIALQAEHQIAHQQELRPLHDRQPDQVRVANQREFLHLHGSQTIILNNPDLAPMEHRVIVEVELPEAGVVLAEVVVPEAVAVEEGDNKL